MNSDNRTIIWTADKQNRHSCATCVLHVIAREASEKNRFTLIDFHVLYATLKAKPKNREVARLFPGSASACLRAKIQ